ncbi:MAG: bifunctional DNA-formamidopyrimidine glycosylase/DNA-(apurinic or apyrimidinic site) lyase [Pseudomonadota bacterium]
MPELPEVETTRRGVSPHIVGHRVERLIVREPRLRWPVPAHLAETLEGQVVQGIRRRAKYLLMDTNPGSLIVHLGMSGRLQVVPSDHPCRKHDHVDIVFDHGYTLRFHDPRRFGSMLWSPEPLEHKLIAPLGPEPLSGDFDGDYLYERSRGRKAAIKTFIMDARIVVGVGNIYASEALFMAGIHPLRAAGRVSRQRMRALADAIKSVLGKAIEAGGTTLRDFFGVDGSSGYFAQQLAVYGRADEACRTCGDRVRQRVIGQRSTFYCNACQT